MQHEWGKQFLATLPKSPGVYRFYDQAKSIIYVGKAKNLNNRVRSYFRKHHDHPKVTAMMRRAASADFEITDSEYSALLLEYNLIKEHRPVYNILLKDDKSYPYLYLSPGEFPRLSSFRGRPKGKGDYFGPYPNVESVRQALNSLQRMTKLRSCSDSYFKSRKRPCLQYEIKRCTAPCVGKISANDYADSVKTTRELLKGKNQEVMDRLVDQMQTASNARHYEKAADLRDTIKSIASIQAKQSMISQVNDADIFVYEKTHMGQSFAVAMIRGGHMLGHKVHFPEDGLMMQDANEVIRHLLLQHYMTLGADAIPGLIILGQAIHNKTEMACLLSELAGHKVKIVDRPRHQLYLSWLDYARKNAQNSMAKHFSQKENWFKRFELLTQFLQQEVLIEQIDCFDISHTQGGQTIASCVVCNHEGMKKTGYRRYPLSGTGGDDYLALTKAVKKHYQSQKEKNKTLPDLLLIDGGKGQLNAVYPVIQDLAMDDVYVMSISKGPERKAGMEILHHVGGREDDLSADDPLLHLLQSIRDEAHRFAITAHRQKRAKQSLRSELLEIPGCGAQKRRALLDYLGGFEAVKSASYDQLTKVPGIGPKLAKVIYESLHSGV